eukprot:CAMPEP_0118641990 /NCGR_PEP_ID=MMETSP0785-20121206/5601_1 /TAXON_ID=91992 /ORGANISM="Bolidomonas pacifica, Strain CCMP 1866" /LENGTH=256 /DNA_ID=CAMNT_0006533521 /DNA_START=41 /DNA_END=808 /DNA_ORIENTATION=+
MPIACEDYFSWRMCWSLGSLACCDYEKSSGIPFSIATCEVPCDKWEPGCSFSNFAGSTTTDPDNQCETKFKLSSPGLICVLLGVLYLLLYRHLRKKRNELTTFPWKNSTSGGGSTCPFTNTSLGTSSKTCKVCGSRVSSRAFMETKDKSYSYTSTTSTTTTTTYVSRYQQDYNHCVGCHASESSKNFLLGLLLGGIVFLAVGIFVGMHSSAEAQDALEGSLTPIYGIGIPIVICGALCGFFAYRFLCGGLVGNVAW